MRDSEDTLVHISFIKTEKYVFLIKTVFYSQTVFVMLTAHVMNWLKTTGCTLTFKLSRVLIIIYFWHHNLLFLLFFCS